MSTTISPRIQDVTNSVLELVYTSGAIGQHSPVGKALMLLLEGLDEVMEVVEDLREDRAAKSEILPFTGDEEVKGLLVRLANSRRCDCEITRSEVLWTARNYGLLKDLVGQGGVLSPCASKRLGRRLQRYRGQVLEDSYGRKFQFGHRRSKEGATYPLTFLHALDRVDPETMLPCPFCGSSDVIVRPRQALFEGFCDSCLTTGPLSLNSSQALRDWNKRPLNFGGEA